MKILLGSNFTVNSGYAFQARMLADRIPTLGHEVVVMDIRPGGGATAQVGAVTVLPTALDVLGNDIIAEHAQRSQADVVITLCDAWGFNPETMKRCPAWWPITPIDHSPVPPAVLHSLQAVSGVIALSRFGQAELRKVGIEALYMPHGLDPAVWQPALTREAMREARRKARMPDDVFLVSFVGVNDSNPSRKGIPELLAAWAMFHHTHPDSLLYLHTTAQGNIPIAGPKNGVDVDVLVKTFAIPPASIRMPDEYRLRTGIPAHELATIAQGSDVFILPSRGEGFGIPLIEFQHAGCPVITTDFGGGAELCASGWLIDGEVEWGWQNATVLRPGIASIMERLEQAYSERGNLARRLEAAQFARAFEMDTVIEQYVAPTLAQIAESIVLAQTGAAA
jgi:glycosyltransferase involved in cell wall biosynthesis